MVSGGTVTGDLSSLKSNLTSYSSEISGLDGSWKGPSHDNLIAKADEFVSEYSSAIEGEMSAFASACDLYQEYDATKKNYNTAMSNYNTALSNKDSSAITTYGNQVASYSTQLNKLKSQIESLLATAKAVTLQATSATGATTTGSSLSSLGTPTYGTFEKMTYKASNGTTISYYMYVPNYGTSDVSGLPVHVYLHGSGETGSGVLDIGLPKLIKDQKINPSGIVLCIQAKSTSDFSNSKYQDAVIELTQSVCQNNGGDSSKISMSGHSMGAIAGYKIIERYPDYFSAFIPISGSASNQSRAEAAKNVKVWAFHGAKDTNVNYSDGAAAVQYIQNAGGFARLYTFENAGHGNVQNYTFEDEYEDENGNKVNPLEWAFQQTKKA